ncbi:MAG TPA: carboxylesterase family protein, partial [Trebonia sp.]
MGSAEPEVSTAAGRVRGRAEHGNAVFRGIPFARPPVGALRFQAPELPAGWDGVREAAKFGPQCPQAAIPGGPGTPGAAVPPADSSGEWLTVNVWTPDPEARTLPVMVWIHGGAYMFGTGGPGYDGTPFASAEAVFVSCNYRLGVEGFAQIDGVPANRGLLDVVAALRWVRENIGAFGGDPANVTVFGESAGAGVIAALLAMDSARGLFRRAIAQSVPGTFFSAALATAVTEEIAAAAGLPATRAALSGADPQRLVAAQVNVAGRMKEFLHWGALRISDTPFSPVVDGEVLTRAPWRALVSGAAREVELLTGHNKEEYRLFIAMSGRLGR